MSLRLATSIPPSLAALGSEAGPLIGRHFDRTFRTLSGRGVVADSGFFRLLSGEAHPLGNLAVLTSPVTAIDRDRKRRPNGLSNLLCDRIGPSQLGEARKIAVVRVQLSLVFDGVRCELNVGGEAAGSS